MPVSGIDDIRRLEEEIGVNEIHVCYRNPYMKDTMTVQEKVDWVNRFGDEVIARY